MDFRQLIKNWHVRASDESLDYFSKFIFEYLSFVAVLKRIRFANENSDMRAIIRLKEDDVKFKYLELLINNTLGTADAWQLIKQELMQEPMEI